MSDPVRNDTVRMYVGLARRYVAMESWGQAVAYADRALALRPDDAEASALRARAIEGGH